MPRWRQIARWSRCVTLTRTLLFGISRIDKCWSQGTAAGWLCVPATAADRSIFHSRRPLLCCTNFVYTHTHTHIYTRTHTLSVALFSCLSILPRLKSHTLVAGWLAFKAPAASTTRTEGSWMAGISVYETGTRDPNTCDSIGAFG